MSGLIIAAVAATCGTVGGMLAATGEGIWRRASMGRSRAVVTEIGLLFVFVTALFLLALATRLFSGQLTGFQLALSILIWVPILCGLAMWLSFEEKQKRIGNRFRD